jgi:hypothetical protein
MHAVHRHTSRFEQKRMGFAALGMIALVALGLTSFTGNVMVGMAGVAALAGALVMGISVACHKGCSPH